MSPRTTGRRRRVPEALRIRLLQQEAVARLGQRALKGTDLAGLMDDAVASVARALEVSNGEILELLPGRHALLLRAEIGRASCRERV